jgi:hypothetical protein
MFVAVERDQLAPGVKVRPGGTEISKGRRALDKLEVRQPAGRVVDKDKKCALRTAILKPPMLAAVDLNQLANTVAPGAGLMDTLSPLLAIDPQLGLDHPQPQCLTTERNPMNRV